MKRSIFAHAQELSSVLKEAPANDGAFVGISDARLIVRALRCYDGLKKAVIGGTLAAMMTVSAAPVLWPLADLDRDGRLSMADAAVALHGMASRFEPDLMTATVAALEDNLEAPVQVHPVRVGCRLAPLVEAAAVAQ